MADIVIESWDEATQSVVKRTLSEAQYREEFGEDDAWRFFKAPKGAVADMPADERRFYEKMQDQEATNAALAASGHESALDVPMESGDDTWTPPADWPESGEYDYEGALRDLESDHPEMLPEAGGA